jgi:hypothetical protein
VRFARARPPQTDKGLAFGTRQANFGQRPHRPVRDDNAVADANGGGRGSNGARRIV